MRFVELFAGLGGITRGLEPLGHQCVGFVEIDPYRRAVLRKHWPSVPQHDDVRTFTGAEFGPFDLLTATYPCQPFSHAGDQQGHTHEAHLWPEVARVIRDVRPRYVLLENVVAHLSVGFDTVLGDLAALRYDATWDCVPASAVGAPHQRDRLWVVAYPNEDGESVVPFHDEAQWLPPPARVGWPDWRSDAGAVGVDDGVPDRFHRARLEALGDSVVPHVAEHVGRWLP